MQQLKVALVCVAVLYGVDAIWFNGWYVAAADRVIARAWQLDW